MDLTFNIPPAEDKTPAGFNFASFPEDTQPPRVFPDIQSTRRRSYPSPRPGGAGTERRKHPRPAAAPAKPAAGQKQRSRRRNRSSRTRTEAQPAQLDPRAPSASKDTTTAATTRAAAHPHRQQHRRPEQQTRSRRPAAPAPEAPPEQIERKYLVFEYSRRRSPAPAAPPAPRLIIIYIIYMLLYPSLTRLYSLCPSASLPGSKPAPKNLNPDRAIILLLLYIA